MSENYLEQALKKLDKKTSKLGRAESVICKAVVRTLKDFCGQNPEFAQAVAQGGTLPDCLTACVKGVVAGISDLDVYKRAVQFYFPSADVHMNLILDLGDRGASGGEETLPGEMNRLELSLDSLLDF